jgi:hypothetical protein
VAAARAARRQRSATDSIRAIVRETPSPNIDVVRGRLGAERGDEVLAFWAEHSAMAEEEARRRLRQVVCVVRHDGGIAGVTSVHPEEVPLIAGRRFWIYRAVLTDAAAPHELEVIAATLRALESEYDGDPDSPIGLCLLLSEADRRRLPPEADWSEPPVLYAGYLEDGRQVRIGYFEGVSIVPGPPVAYYDWELDASYQVEVFSEQDAVTEADVIALWLREAGLNSEQAHRRVAQVSVVVTDAKRRLVGVSTAYLQRDEQVQADLWHVRAFVTKAHRGARIVVALAVTGRDHLVRRYESGEDRRGIGIIYVVQSAHLKRAYPTALWPWVAFAYIGENARGDDLRVQYFQGAVAPEPGPRLTAPGA